MTRKPLSLARQQDAERLKSIWVAYKDNARANGKKVTQDIINNIIKYMTAMCGLFLSEIVDK